MSCKKLNEDAKGNWKCGDSEKRCVDIPLGECLYESTEEEE